ncbi:YuzF family protein [Microaerobacter geothermalis]|uniref:DUF2642 domain-containing protein n=1 Tax=Microaerobacter geothermalis TaxID=674972 RepID=UPI001F417031|nr:DUF2642 domain-containing protein [Microaerobacter geothermalis]MCF6094174.1 YuzF family protein [Microaerobacter geothermalis]
MYYYNPYYPYRVLKTSTNTREELNREYPMLKPKPEPKEFMDPFLKHLSAKVNRVITVSTTGDTITGTLKAVYSDHIVVLDDGKPVHIRTDQIIYVRD